MEEKWRKLRELEAQRSDISTKLQKIEDKKDTVSVEVYLKVKKEYEDKLKKFDVKLAEYVDLIKEDIASARQEEEKLLEQEKDINLKIEELKLRYSIGEYTDESFRQIESENNENLKVIAVKLDRLREKIKWFDDFMELKGLEASFEKKEVVKPKKDILIEEHILEEKPADEMKLEDILVPEEAVKPEAAMKEESFPQPKPPKTETKGVPCPKCGFVNVPDSWYCEKCGAEILDTLVK